MTPTGRLWRLLRDEDGFVISTEAMLWIGIVSLSVLVGIATVRFALLEVYIDAAESLATRESSFTFDESDPRFFFKRPDAPDPNFFDTYPGVGTDSGGFQVVPAEVFGES